MNIENRTLYTYDNLAVLRCMDSESVDLIYLDPPFNTGKTWENPIQAGSTKAMASFKDTWHPSDIHIDEQWELKQLCPQTLPIIDALHKINGGSWWAYLIYMGVRLVEMRRVLKDTGSIYYHCDPVMSHGVKLLMDAIFGINNFRSEIVWKKTNSPKAQAAAYGSQHDVILFYSKSDDFVYNRGYIKPTAQYLKSFNGVDSKGRYQTVALIAGGAQRSENRSCFEFHGVREQWLHKKEELDRMWDEGLIVKTANGYRKKHYLNEGKGSPVSDLWIDKDVGAIQGRSKQKEDYPTQKPLALLERIIKVSSNKGDVVLDPFCGCATTCVAAERTRREWIGIDLSKEAANIVFERLRKDTESPLADPEAKVTHSLKLPKRTDIQPTKTTPELKAELHERQEHKCVLCKRNVEIEDCEVDHIIPQTRGGQDIRRNYQLLCGNCNQRKSDKPMETARREAVKRRIEKETKVDRDAWEKSQSKEIEESS